MEIPIIELPLLKPIKTISIPLPKADVPSYVPLVVPPSDLEAQDPPKSTTSEKEPEAPGIRQIDIPFTDVPVSYTHLTLPTKA